MTPIWKTIANFLMTTGTANVAVGRKHAAVGDKGRGACIGVTQT